MGAKKGDFEKCVQTGKLCFPTKGDALIVIRKPNIRSANSKKRKKREKRAYLCEYCNFYHLTSAEYFKDNLDNPKKKKNVQKSRTRRGSEEKNDEGS
jgi:hypothetical protein